LPVVLRIERHRHPSSKPKTRAVAFVGEFNLSGRDRFRPTTNLVRGPAILECGSARSYHPNEHPRPLTLYEFHRLSCEAEERQERTIYLDSDLVAHVQHKSQRPRPWIARYAAPDGRERSRAFARKLDADRFLAAVEGGKLRGEWVDPALGRVRVDDWTTRWLDGARPTLKPKTVAAYESLLRSRILPALGSYALSALRPSDIAAWIGAMQADHLSASRIRQAHVVLTQLLDAAVLDERITRNPAAGARLPRLQRREAAFLEPELVEAITAEHRPPYDLLVRILGMIGPRFGEAAALRRRSVDVVGRRIVITESLAEVNGRHIFGPTKTHATRRVPLPRSLAEALTARLEEIPAAPGSLVFTSPNGAPLRHSAFRSRRWLPALRRVRVPAVGIHVLRHSAAAAMIRAGASPKAIQTVLGRASAAFTLTVYGHLFDADLDALADRLDGLSEASNIAAMPER
jgi:integrase